MAALTVRRLLQGDGVLSTQKKVVMMVQVTKPREIIFADRDTGNVSTHLIVPGMVVERYDGKPLGAIDTDPEQVARIINEHVDQYIRFKRRAAVRPLRLRFREEPGMGYPLVLNVSEEAKKHSPKLRRGSIFKGERENKEVRAAATHARRMSIDSRRMSLSGEQRLEFDAARASSPLDGPPHSRKDRPRGREEAGPSQDELRAMAMAAMAAPDAAPPPPPPPAQTSAPAPTPTRHALPPASDPTGDLDDGGLVPDDVAEDL